MRNVRPRGFSWGRTTAALALVLFLVLPGVSAETVAPRELAPFSSQPQGGEVPPPWVHRTLPNVARENLFVLERSEADVVLRVDSDAAASTMLHPLNIDPGVTPKLSWRWKVSGVVEKSDFSRREGDDYAAKVYVLFDYPAARLSRGERAKIALARTFYGEELPAAAIAYVWGTAQAAGESGPNPYTDRVRKMVVESGTARVGEWVAVQRDIARDFEAVFGEPAPPVIGVALSADTDNTGERVTAWFGDPIFTP